MAGFIRPQHVDEGERVGHRRHVVEVEGLEVGSVVEYVGQLAGEGVEFVVGQRQACQVRHVGDIVTGEARCGGHGWTGRAGREGALRIGRRPPVLLRVAALEDEHHPLHRREFLVGGWRL